ncbi:acetate/propionate family kinase [Granulicella sp. WH15]|nr:acetate/propionate family kinase [Granulicella sp. WH15]
MRILVVNSGSSSIKFSIFDSGAASEDAGLRCVFEGELTGIGGAEAQLEVEGKRSTVQAGSQVEAIRLVFDTVAEPVDAVGYRVVHPGPHLEDHQRVTPEVLEALEAATAFAPLHDPEAVKVIREGLARFPQVGHYACFDTVFHRTMPEEATTYALPESVRAEGVHRYGFHGLSCESIVRQMQVAGPLPRRMAIAHLGSGCSVTAVVDGRSVDTTMGLTPTGGVVMGTRPGDLDPGLMLYLLRRQQGDKDAAIAAVEAMVNHNSGMVALSGMANDMRAVRKAAAAGDVRAQLAVKVFTRSVTKAIAGFCWTLGGLDAIVFAGGIGEHDALTRTEVLAGLESQGVAINSSLNDSKSDGAHSISASDSHTLVLVVPAQEDRMIAMHVSRMDAIQR